MMCMACLKKVEKLAVEIDKVKGFCKECEDAKQKGIASLNKGKTK